MKTIVLCGLLGFSAAACAGEGGARLYSNDFEKEEAGKLPAGFLGLNGEFVVKALGTNKVLELPGAPLDSFAAQFGPAETVDVAVRVRIYGTGQGRRGPTFGVGVGGAGGWRLQVSPGKKAVELFKNDESKASAPYAWKSGTWTRFRLQLRKVKDGAWRVEGKVWAEGGAEPREWTVAADETETPVGGRASVAGSPFSGTPIWFDDLVVERVGQ